MPTDDRHNVVVAVGDPERDAAPYRSRRRARLLQRTSSDSEVTVRSRWDRSDAESGADAESLTVAVLYRWAGEVLSFRAQGSADTVEAVKPGSRGDHRDVTVQMLKAED
jgi:hypothetical protein